MRKTIYLLIITCQLMLTNGLLAQGASINTDGSSPHASAILDLKSTSKGFLLPRLSQTQRMSINNPANGLMVYDTTSKRFYFWDNPFWKYVLTNDAWIQSISHNWLYNFNDSIGLGITSPVEKMHIHNGNLLLSRPPTSSNSIIFDTDLPGGIYTETQGIGFDIDGVSKASIKYIYTNDAFAVTRLRLSASSPAANDMVITSQGNVGVGTGTPGSKLHVIGTMDASPTENGYIMTGQSNSINMVMDNNEILVRNNGNPSDMSLQRDEGNLLLCGLGNGKVGIGITSSSNIPTGYMLAVDGKAICEELRVELSGAWPDYVFESTYPIKPLDQLEMEIHQLGHLPGMPSSAELEKEGMELGEMQRKMMEKIEELTLYILSLNKENIVLQEKISTLENNLNQLLTHH